jgi:Thioredoxin
MAKSKWLVFSFILACAVAVAGQEQGAIINWTDATRDVFVGGQVDRTMQALYSETPKRMALIGPHLDRALVLDLDANTVGTLPKEALNVVADHTSATSSANDAAEMVGMLTVIDETTYAFDFAGKSFMITRHKGIVGEITEAQVWDDVPIWRTLMDKYQPDAQAVAELKKNKQEVTVMIAAGTWCGDSKHYVPQLLRALHDAGNQRIQIKLVGIANKFVEPAEFVKQREIKKVPTIIVERKGHEIGRIVETPTVKSMEADLAALLAGKPNAPATDHKP